MVRLNGSNDDGWLLGPLADSPGLDGNVRLIDRSGSDRMFYRVASANGSRLIVMRYGRGRAENEQFVPVARLLSALGIPVPEILAWDPERRLVWMEDLGDSSLWSVRNEPWAYRSAIYRQVLRHAATLHRFGQANAIKARLRLERQFDEALYRWEQEYFFDNCLGRHFGLGSEETSRLQNLPALSEIARRLAAAPRALIHRDLQSQNVLLRGGGEAVFIDFQGARPGVPLYDVASLLLDPYVSLKNEERTELLFFYCSAMGYPDKIVAEEFPLCAIQRLMQAMGAYGFLGHTKGKTEFLLHIPTALERLKIFLAQIPGLESLAKTLESLS